MVFLVNLARVVFAPLVQPLSDAFGVAPGAIGLVTAAAWLGSALPRAPAGLLLTRVDRHRVVALAGVVLTGSALFASTTDSLEALAVGALLMGLSSGTYFVAANPLVAELFPERVGRMLGIHGMSSQLAAVGAPLVVLGVLAVGDWRLSLRLVGAVAALATVGLVLVARRTDMPAAGVEDRDLFAGARAQWRIVFTGVALTGAIGFVWNGVFNFYPTYLEAKGVSEGTAGLLLSVVFAAGVPAFLLTGWLADRVPNVPLLLAIVGGFVVCLLGLVAASGLVAILVVSVALGYVVHSLYPAADTYLLASLPDQHRASAYTAYSATTMLPQAGGSYVVGALSTSYAYGTVFAWLAGGLALVLILLLGLYSAGRLPAGHVPT